MRRLPISSLHAAQEHIRDWRQFLVNFRIRIAAQAVFRKSDQAA